jgi:outer membrane lipoprotein-sorting protein
MKKTSTLALLSLIIAILTFTTSIDVVAATPTAQQVLNRTVAEIGKAKNITAPFTMTASGKSISGTLKMSGKKFFLNLQQNKVWFDGTNQWALDASTKEVNITEPTHDELAQVNPIVIISALYKSCTPQLLKSSAAGTYTLRLTPNAKQHLSFSKVVVDVNSKSYLPSRIVLTLESGQTATFKIGSINTATVHAASTFVFNKSNYPGYKIIDLR